MKYTNHNLRDLDIDFWSLGDLIDSIITYATTGPYPRGITIMNSSKK